MNTLKEQLNRKPSPSLEHQIASDMDEKVTDQIDINMMDRLCEPMIRLATNIQIKTASDISSPAVLRELSW